ncbi:DUF29 family protein [Photorhabdus laumondii subsp. laumondii]|uniref:Photorhabdus luminescens subsp. laumondii TTO1 complete genome segment 14/17 n=2 Tax=Photorhabdus laumondii subsp. laumondii TaxID=141679 RepID=Q7MZY9_PHOLL|nr:MULTISPECIES: DUF29 domain-containing protein [Photorhabdus]AWK43694.1 hypothetical protein A4R40_20430 [Photorhabdus laumondii subsp. laumondii]AXG44374.1 DUF29 domain-containing protein [Photorhabdus laumondii subsp. laumondii]AXG49004.1 DUF29 domain-containing protein [Photorhabdus laumondii subsp. laumondii]KTL62940.1 hypothetical protein AA106_18810 [Photorhabdus laumondii subsp. laumondii]MCC8386077.1 DUF29 domain-containing protein [Photorhabdus laumondii]
MTTRYNSDFYGWTQEQASLLRSGDLSQLDRENLSEEIESMGNSQRNELESRLEVLFLHLLKWQFQSERQGRSWKLTIEEQRRKIARRLKKNPSLKSELSEISSDAYGDAIIAAERETNIRRSVFPETCPWTFEQIMDENFWPE